jgi:competence protein ComEC
MLPEPQSSLAAGILIDGKQSINGELQEKFRKTGLVHIVVLSGYNVSIVAEAITKVFMFLPRFAGMFSAIAGIIAFALITGASATVIRASIMAIIVILSRMSLRNYDPARGLFIASFLMLVHNPSILLNSPSFQLSFLATFAVIRVVPVFERWGSLIPKRFGLRDLVISNIVVQAFLFPVLSWMTGFVSVVSLPVNLLVLPFIPLTMLMNFITAMIGLVPLSIFNFLALPFAFISQTLLSYELAVVNFFSALSFAEVSFRGFSIAIVIGFYIVTIFWLLIFSKKGVDEPKA